MTIKIFYRGGERLQEGDIFRHDFDSGYRWLVGSVGESGFYYSELTSQQVGYSEDTITGVKREDWVLVSRKEALKKTGFSQFITSKQL